MSLVKWTDSSNIPTITSMFDKFFTDGEDFYKELSKGTSVPAVNVVESADNYQVEVAVPGKNKEDFKVEIDNHVLCISSENEEEKETEEKNYTRKEYNYSAFSRSFTLPENAKEEAIQASYDNGVLKVTIAKKVNTETSTKSIPVA